MKLFILETERLRILPLSHSQLINYLRLDGSLEEQLGVNYLMRKIDPELIEAFEEVILPTVGNPSRNYLFSTIWTIIEKDKNVMVGDICFKGEPDQSGEVEVGYGTYAQFQNKGYMTEALKAITNWALQQPGVICIKAETHTQNLPSQKILKKTGFSLTMASNGMIQWVLPKAKTLIVERA
jgi:hypothetical protein